MQMWGIQLSGLCRGRFAPSPSGEMHLGNAWTALLAWLQVRSSSGEMVLRIEDLDPDRSKPVFIEQLIRDLRWLGLDWHEGPDIGGDYGLYRQDERRHLYDTALAKLDEAGFLYPCYCSRVELRSVAQAPHAGEMPHSYPGTCRFLTIGQCREKESEGRKASLRLRVPSGNIMFTDLCQGFYGQDILHEVGDFIVRRADGVHAYQLAVVVDDAAMKITHVLRGADLLDSTPRQLLIYQLLGLEMPQFAHVPLILGEDGQRLSKRHGDVSLAGLRRKGVKPETIVGYLAYKANLTNQWESLTTTELIAGFDLRKIPLNAITVTNHDMENMR
jgi:glutamyl-tRNA synthetase